MKNYIVYNLDTGLPIGVGGAIKADWARAEIADKSKIKVENLFAEEINSDIKTFEIQKNSKPNPRIMRRPNICRCMRCQSGGDCVIDSKVEALRRAERYSATIHEIWRQSIRNKTRCKIPTFDEWLKDDSAAWYDFPKK